MKANNFIEFEIIYKLNQNETKIFDYSFIDKNKDKCKMIYKNKEYELEEYFEYIDNNYKNKEKISFILKINKNITHFNHMFSGCKELLLIRDKSQINIFNDTLISNDINDEINLSNEDNQNDEIFNQNEENNLYKGLEDDQISSISLSTITNKYTCNNFLTNNINNEDNLLTSSQYYNFNQIFDMSYMFNGCESLISLPDISNWNTSNVIDMSAIFYGCKSIISLPDISKWNTTLVDNMSYMFNGCKSLISLPEISKWNTTKVDDMCYMFNECESLISLPNISKWNTSNINNMSYMFNECKSLISLPDISKWNTSNVIDMCYMFNECKSLISLPDISKWNTSIVGDMCYMFNECKSLISLPDITKWNTPKVIDNRTHESHHDFYRVKSLTSLSDISKWNNHYKNIKTYINYMFNGCESLISLPDISKWNTSYAIGMSYIFDGCINCLNTTPKSIKRNNFYRFNHIK